MRNVVLYQLMSFDGVSEEPGNWFFDDGPEHLANIGHVVSDQTDVLLGRTTYEYWVGYWPTAAVEPFASFINGVTKHVASSTPLATPWHGAARIEGPVDEYVRALKSRAGGPIGIHGSTTLAHRLIEVDLVDEIRLAIAPTIAGEGARLFPESASVSTRRLELVNLERSPKGTVFAHYRLDAD